MKDTEIYNPKLNPLQKELVRELCNSLVAKWLHGEDDGAIKKLKEKLGL